MHSELRWKLRGTVETKLKKRIVGNETELGAIRHNEESEKVGLKLNFQKKKIMVSGPITSWQ